MARSLLKAAERSVDLATKALDDYTLSPRDRKAAEDRLRMGNFQRTILLGTQSGRDNDFYIYRYLATEGFLPGYNFPRLPLMAYVQGGQDGKSEVHSTSTLLGYFRVWPAKSCLS